MDGRALGCLRDIRIADDWRRIYWQDGCRREPRGPTHAQWNDSNDNHAINNNRTAPHTISPDKYSNRFIDWRAPRSSAQQKTAIDSIHIHTQHMVFFCRRTRWTYQFHSRSAACALRIRSHRKSPRGNIHKIRVCESIAVAKSD